MLVLPWNERYEPQHVDYLAEAIADAVVEPGGSASVSDSLAFGLIGAGGIAQSYLQVFSGLKAAHIAAVADVRLEAATSAAEALGCEAFGSWEELAERRALDAVLICTPPVTHTPKSPGTSSRGASPCCARSRSPSISRDARELAAAERGESTPCSPWPRSSATCRT